MNSWPRQQELLLRYHATLLLGLPSAQTILPFPFSSTFTVPSSHYKQARIIHVHKPFLQLFRLDHSETHENFAWPFYEK